MPNPDNLSGRRLPRLLDIAGVAEHLAVSERHVRRLVAERRLDSSERDEDGTEAASASYPTRTDGGAYMPTRRRRTAGSVRRLPSGRWQARIRDPRTNMLESLGSFDSKADADRAVAVAIGEGLRGQWASPALGKRRLSDWVDDWWATTTDLAPTTRVRDEWLLHGHILPAFGSAALADIGQLDVRSWVAELSASGLAPNTVHKAYQVLSKAVAAAVDAGLLAITPCRNVPLPKVEHREMRFLSPADLAHLAAVINPRYRALVL